MQTRVSKNGHVKVPAALLQKVGIRPGDFLDIAIESDRIVLIPNATRSYVAQIIEDPITGFSVLCLGPNAPTLTSEMVRELLKDFP